MYCIVEFCRLIVTAKLSQLDLTDVIEMLRWKIYDLLPQFPHLKLLKLGCGSGGVSDVFRSKFKVGLAVMHRLVSFALPYDCSDDILQILCANCYETLRILDVEQSHMVTDDSVRDIVICKKIIQLHIFHTGISRFGQARILIGLPELRCLVRGDFLCEALELVRNSEDFWTTLMLEEFWSSEDYFFHDVYQMKVVSEMCPLIRKITFQFNLEVISDYMVLSNFEHVRELNLWGGEFYGSKILDLLQRIGRQINVLQLVHIDQLDEHALAIISNECPNLEILGFHNCRLRELVYIDPEVMDDFALRMR